MANMFKKYFFKTNFHPEFIKKYNFWKFLLPKDTPFLCKIPLLTQRPLFLVIFASPNAPYIENHGLTPASLLYGSDPPDLTAQEFNDHSSFLSVLLVDD